jgi:arsenate reductase-like glutaredoxin family protein
MKTGGAKLVSIDFSFNPLKDNGVQSLAIGLVEKLETGGEKQKESKGKSDKDIRKTQNIFKKSYINLEHLNLSQTEMSEAGLNFMLKKLEYLKNPSTSSQSAESLTLILNNNNFSDECLKHISDFLRAINFVKTSL